MRGLQRQRFPMEVSATSILHWLKKCRVFSLSTHENIGPLYRTPPSAGLSLLVDERRPPLENNTISYYGQYVAVAVAQTVEQARAAAEAVKITYVKKQHNTSGNLLGTPILNSKPREVTKRGDTGAALASAGYKHDAIYTTPTETHNPIELHASVAVHKDGKFTLYETSKLSSTTAMLWLPCSASQLKTFR